MSSGTTECGPGSTCVSEATPGCAPHCASCRRYCDPASHGACAPPLQCTAAPGPQQGVGVCTSSSGTLDASADGWSPPPACGPATCMGCCSGDTCLGGLADTACGANGAACLPCASGGMCVRGVGCVGGTSFDSGSGPPGDEDAGD